MKFVSSRDRQRLFSLKEAVFMGLAPDGGLFMPAEYPEIQRSNITDSSSAGFAGLAFQLAKPFLKEDLDDDTISRIITASFDFEIPLRAINDNIFALELFHGPTLAFKDIGARFMARLMAELNSDNKDITILVATSGDTGGAVASAFHGIENIKVTVLYPEGKVSEFQRKQFTTLGDNVSCLAVEGNFDDCQRLVKEAFNDKELRKKIKLSSANSINIGRWLPQSFYYFWGIIKWYREFSGISPVIAVPSGNYGNLTAGMLAYYSGVPVSGFIAASNINNTVPEYLETGVYSPRKSTPTVANAMDVGDPSNFERMKYMGGSRDQLKSLISAYTLTDQEITGCISAIFEKTGYILDPHSATGYLALKKSGKKGFFIATAHPVKFLDVIPENVRKHVELPSHFRESKKKSMSISISADYADFRQYLEGN
ncbi:MAG: threonine synthase [Bacteroidales bacterium]|nr:threonine synthase [Bacteroidales bacterium]